MNKEEKSEECKNKATIGCFPYCKIIGTVLECPDVDTCPESSK